jgi:hypothetical protein
MSNIPMGILSLVSPVATVTFEAAAGTAAGTVYTFAGHDLGAAGTKKVIICVNPYDGGAHTINTVTVDGQSASQVVEVTSSAVAYKSQIWEVNTATAATGDVVVTASGAIGGCFINTYAAIGAAAAASYTATSTANPGNATIDCPAGGFIIGSAITNATTTISWTNLTEDTENILCAGRMRT